MQIHGQSCPKGSLPFERRVAVIPHSAFLQGHPSWLSPELFCPALSFHTQAPITFNGNFPEPRACYP